MLTESPGQTGDRAGLAARIWDVVRRSMSEFLLLPTVVIAAFVLLAAVMVWLDRAHLPALEPLRRFLLREMFSSPRAASDLLGAIATSIITVTSITVSVLLLALQQSAATLTPQVYDQFLRRKLNQVYFGTFVGLALYSLVMLTTTAEPQRPVFGASAAFLLTCAALYLLVLLLYTTVNQMRPVVILSAIHDHALRGRRWQRTLIGRTRRQPLLSGAAAHTVRLDGRGFVTLIDLACIEQAIGAAQEEVEVVLLVSIGSFAAFGDEIAQVKARRDGDAAALIDAVERGIHFERQRDITHDPAFAVEELENIGWTSISSAKSNPMPGLLAIRILRDLLATWAAEEQDQKQEREPAIEPLPVVYADTTIFEAMNAMESMAVVASESMQHQSFAAVVQGIASIYGRLPEAWRNRADDLVRRSLTAMGDLVLGAELDAGLTSLAARLSAAGRTQLASQVQTAHRRMAAGLGELRSRSTRAK